MSLEHAQEQALADEAVEQAFLSQSLSSLHDPSTSSTNTNGKTLATIAENPTGETSPLLGSDSRPRQEYLGEGNSFVGALNEPWVGADGNDGLPWYKRPSLWWLLPAFIPSCISLGGMIVPKTYLILDLICSRYLSDQAAKDPSFTYLPPLFGADNQQCRVPEVQQLVTYFNTYGNLLSGIFSALVAPYLGSLSDRIGRKNVLVLASMGVFVTEIITIIVGRNPDTISVYWILVGFLADGLSGSFPVVLAVAMAYAADCTAPETRAVSFGYLYGTFFAGIAVGPLITTALAKATGDSLSPFYLGLACHLFYVLFVIFLVPESVSEQRQAKAREKYARERAQMAGRPWIRTLKQNNIFRQLRILAPTGPGTSAALRRNLVILSSIDFLMFGVVMGTMSILMVYPQYKFGWTSADTSYYYSTTSIVRVIGLLVLLPVLVRVFRGKFQLQSGGGRGADNVDLNIVRASIIFDLLGYLGYAFAPTGVFMYAAGIIASIGGIGSPTITSTLSKHVPADVTGQLLGAVGLLHSVGRVVSPLLFSIIYAETIKIFPGLVFLCLASIWIVAAVLSWLLKPNICMDDGSLAKQDTPHVQTDSSVSGDHTS